VTIIRSSLVAHDLVKAMDTVSSLPSGMPLSLRSHFAVSGVDAGDDHGVVGQEFALLPGHAAATSLLNIDVAPWAAAIQSGKTQRLTQAAAEAEQEPPFKQAEFGHETAIVKAQYMAEVDNAQAQAAQAGTRAEAQAQREVLAMRTELAERAAELRQQDLFAEVGKPAETDRSRPRLGRR
jgi:hypothetical protein